MKNWLKINSLIFFIVLFGIGTLNFLIDPLWCFQYKNALQSHREGFEERQQKINLIHFQNFDYQAVILGSSRTTIHDPKSIPHITVFNLAADGMRPYEFNDYINYAKQANQKDFNYIVLGLDFLTIENSPKIYNIGPYIKNTHSPLYRYKSLFSYDTLRISIKNIKNAFFGRYKKRFKTYDENHIAFTHPKDPSAVNEAVKKYLSTINNKIIHYDRQNYLNTLRLLKQNNPNTTFIVFTTPLPTPIIQNLFKIKENQRTYERWLNDILNNFGPFYNFLYINAVNTNFKKTYVDEGHYTSEVGNCINGKIFGKPCLNPLFLNFGILINKNATIRDINAL